MNKDLLEARNTTKKRNKKDSVLLGLFICSNELVQHCPRPLAPASAELYFQTDSEWAQWSQRTIKYDMHYNDVRGDVLRPSHGTRALSKTRQRKKKDNDQELIQSNPAPHPQN